MDRSSFRCVICGLFVTTAEDETAATWPNEFRTIHTYRNEPWLSGVGIHLRAHVGDFTAPNDPNETWRTIGPGDELITVPIMSQEPIEEVRGFVIHESCWQLMEFYIKPRELDVARLLELCDSVPYSSNCRGLTWDHCYGGLIYRDDEDGFPWDEKYRPSDLSEKPQFPAEQYRYADPWKLNVSSPAWDVDARPPDGPTEYGPVPDCFAQLPFELREMIALLLTTQEMFNLRAAARNFLPVFDSKRFWQSRFWSEGDRGFFYEGLLVKTHYGLRALWRATVHRRKDILFNRERIWSILRIIVPLMDMQTTPEDHRPPHLVVSCAIDPQLGGNLLPASQTGSTKGCTTARDRRIVWPREISRLAVSLADAGGVKYISGLRFTTKDGASICMGYMSSEEQACDIDSEISGFLVAVGSR